MANFNYICLAGNLTHDPDLSYTPSGVAVCKIRLAVNETYKDKDDKEVKDTLFIDCTIWKKQAESTAKYLKKGSGALIAGKLKLNVWTSKDGDKHKKLFIVVTKIVFMAKSNVQKIDEQDEERTSPRNVPDGTPPVEADQDEHPLTESEEEIPI